MVLSNDLVSQFVKITNDKSEEKQETTVYGTTVVVGDKTYVKFDGSDLLTPVTTTSDVKDNERVTVMVKDHTATITGNVSSPSASSSDVKEMGTKISEFEIVIADKVSVSELEAANGRINNLISDNVLIKEKLTATEADISELTAKDVVITGRLDANNASIENLTTTKLDASIANLTYATISSLDATNASINNLEATYGDFQVLTTNKFTAVDATIKKLDAKILTTESLDAKYANIDFANIGDAAIQNLYSKSGLIKDLVVNDGVVSGELTAVQIDGDLIKANTIVADRLVIKGEDGLYYEINTNGEKTETAQTDYNSLNGSVIKAKSITATKIHVTDLVAFGATIGGFHITDDAIYSGAKSTVDNTTRGIYLDSTAQMAIGDSGNYVKYYKKSDGSYVLDISAGKIILGSNNKNVEDSINANATAASNAQTAASNAGTAASNAQSTANAAQTTANDANAAANNAQTSANDAQTTASGVEARIEIAEGTIKTLAEQMSTLVTDENGTSLMEYNSTNNTWYFSTKTFEESVANAQNALNELSKELGSTDATVDVLQKAINDLNNTAKYVTIGTYEDEPCIELGNNDENSSNKKFKVLITNTRIMFREGTNTPTYVDTYGVVTNNITIKQELRHGHYVWAERGNGNYGLQWKETTE